MGAIATRSWSIWSAMSYWSDTSTRRRCFRTSYSCIPPFVSAGLASPPILLQQLLLLLLLHYYATRVDSTSTDICCASLPPGSTFSLLLFYDAASFHLLRSHPPPESSSKPPANELPTRYPFLTALVVSAAYHIISQGADCRLAAGVAINSLTNAALADRAIVGAWTSTYALDASLLRVRPSRGRCASGGEQDSCRRLS